MKLSGQFDVEHWRGGILLGRFAVKNSTNLTALNNILDVYLNGGSATASWYLGLISNTSFTEVSTSDTSGSHAGWTESTAYTSATRPAWGHGAASGQIVQNATLTNFTMNATAALKGLFVISNSTKGGSTGVLLATGVFASARTVYSGDLFPVRYKIIAAAGG